MIHKIIIAVLMVMTLFDYKKNKKLIRAVLIDYGIKKSPHKVMMLSASPKNKEFKPPKDFTGCMKYFPKTFKKSEKELGFFSELEIPAAYSFNYGEDSYVLANECLLNKYPLVLLHEMGHLLQKENEVNTSFDAEVLADEYAYSKDKNYLNTLLDTIATIGKITEKGMLAKHLLSCTVIELSMRYGALIRKDSYEHGKENC